MAMATSSSYPPPPPFYRLYKNFEQDPSSAPEPPPPIDGPFKALGVDYTVCFIILPLVMLLLALN
jgi:mediator of RNA polymerase II transcription subunit 7